MDSFNVADLCQLHQWNLWQKEEKSIARLPVAFDKWRHKTVTSIDFAISALQKIVVSVLHSIGLNPTQEKLTKRGYNLDALIKLKQRKVGDEVDGGSPK